MKGGELFFEMADACAVPPLAAFENIGEGLSFGGAVLGPLGPCGALGAKGLSPE